MVKSHSEKTKLNYYVYSSMSCKSPSCKYVYLNYFQKVPPLELCILEAHDAKHAKAQKARGVRPLFTDVEGPPKRTEGPYCKVSTDIGLRHDIVLKGPSLFC